MVPTHTWSQLRLLIQSRENSQFMSSESCQRRTLEPCVVSFNRAVILSWENLWWSVQFTINDPLLGLQSTVKVTSVHLWILHDPLHKRRCALHWQQYKDINRWGVLLFYFKNRLTREAFREKIFKITMLNVDVESFFVMFIRTAILKKYFKV